MNIDWVLIFRLIAAGLMGGFIGLERELRSKEAGVRTHFIVALGSALFMIISQFAFEGRQHDAARVAAQVVSGIGFIGAGVIIFQKNAVRGVTTAAGLWVAAAIGLACGDGMYSVAIAATVLTVLVLEMMHFVNLHLSEKSVDLTLSPDKPYDIPELPERLKRENIKVDTYSIQGGKVRLTIRVRQKDYLLTIRRLLDILDGFTIDEMS
ncbi:MAG: MgtC/SapB family protein [Bacteroidales bacterium]|nr:MgtC/SapB family protein [Bacteroidales bacterium]MBP5675696.1 MgtC/SapB family protein [Bacteroidales bacterium]